MGMECLVVVREVKLQRALAGVLGSLGVQARVLSDTEQALSALGGTRYDAVIVDCSEFPKGAELIHTMRRAPANGKSVAFAILPAAADSQTRSQIPAHFILQHPLSMDLLTRSLRAARNLMLQEQRRYFRLPVEFSLSLSNGTDEFSAVACNLSAGGMSIKPNSHLDAAWTGKVHFELPEAGGRIEAKAEIAWMLPDKTAGIRFTAISDRCRTLLEQWISSRVIEEETAVAGARG